MQVKDAHPGALAHAASSLLEVKFSGDEKATRSFSGYGAVFNNVDAYGDVILPGAFRETLSRAKSTGGDWPAMLLQHGGGFLGGAEDMTPIGVWTSMHEDEKGLFVEGTLADTQRGRDVYALLKMSPRPAITGLSIGYVAKEWSVRTQPHEPKRSLKAVELIEVSLVTNPANRQARVSGVKSDAEEIREFERLIMRGAGLSRSEARLVIQSGFKSYLAKRDAGDGADPEMLEGLEGLAEQIRNLSK